MDEILTLHLYSDGGSRGNPGPAAAAWLLFTPMGQLLDFGAEYLGTATNNFAEYRGILAGIKATAKYVAKSYPNTAPGSVEVVCHLDSELAVKQLRGEYKIKDLTLQGMAIEVQKLVPNFGETTFVHVERALNKHADKLVNVCLDATLNS